MHFFDTREETLLLVTINDNALPRIAFSDLGGI